MNKFGILDGFGVYGSTLHSALVVAFVGSAFILFLYLWKKGRLDMDEEAKHQMMQDGSETLEKKEDRHDGRR
ncbi:MAG: hypothetical protein ACHQUC_04205 [Chlamydiales bacterium]